MKNKALYGLTLLVSLYLLLFACRKDINNFINDREAAPSMVVEAAKIWRLEHLSVVQKNVRVLKPKWKDAWELSANGEQFLIVPAPEKVVQNKSIKIRRLFVFRLNGSKVMSGEIVELLGVNFDVSKNLDFLLKNLATDKIDGFSGSILRYNINYSAVVSSKTFSKGVRTGDFVLVKTIKMPEIGKTKVEVLGNSTQSSVNRTESICDPVYPTTSGVPMGLAENCLVTFQQITTYDSDGCPVSSVYQYISHTCPGDGSGSGEESGSGSGSGNGTGMSGNPDNPNYGGISSDPVVVKKAYICDCDCSDNNEEMINGLTGYEPKWGQLTDLQGIKNEINKRVGQSQNFNSLPLSARLIALSSYFEANRLFTRDSNGNLVDAPGSKAVDRYMYTENNGWMDMHHLFYTAYWCEVKSTEFAYTITSTAEYIQSILSSQSSSSYSYEDLPSNMAGIKFWQQCSAGLKNGTLDFNSAVMVYFGSNHRSPSQAPNYDYIPHIIDNLSPKNYSSTGLVGALLELYAKESFCKKSYPIQQSIKRAHEKIGHSSH